jgi:hypothetical protein
MVGSLETSNARLSSHSDETEPASEMMRGICASLGPRELARRDLVACQSAGSGACPVLLL